MHKERLLLVEEDPEVSQAIRKVLERTGYTVLTDSSGHEAFIMAQAHHPDLVILDIALSTGISGIETAAIISDQLSIPVMFIAAGAGEKSLAGAKAAHPVGFIHNPSNAAEVEAAVEMALYWSSLCKDLKIALGRAEEEVVKTRAVFSAIGMGIAIVDRTHRILYQNQLHQDLVGKSRFGEFCYSPLTGGGPCPECPIERLFRSGTVETLERESRLGANRQFFEITASPLRNQAGEIVAGIELVKDITARKVMEEELAESEERYRMVTELSPDGIIIHTGDGMITYANSGCGRLFGVGGQDLRSRNLFDFCGTDLRPIYHMMTDAGESGENVSLLESVITTAAGDNVSVEVASVLFLHSGERMIQSIFRDISERKRAEETIRRMAYYDSLTGLPNRRLFDDRLQQVLAQSRRHQRMFAVLFTDLDYFKKVNDTLGHVVGDRLLQSAANRLTECCRRQGDTVARFGGDEFTIILSDLKNREEVTIILEAILSAFSAGFAIDGHVIHISLSIGVSLYPDDADDIHTLLIQADSSLYLAKEDGRATYAFYGSRQRDVYAGPL